MPGEVVVKSQMGLLCVLEHLPSLLWAPSAKELGQPYCVPDPHMDFLKCGVDVLGTLSQASRPGLERLPGAIRGRERKWPLV